MMNTYQALILLRASHAQSSRHACTPSAVPRLTLENNGSPLPASCGVLLHQILQPLSFTKHNPCDDIKHDAN